MRPAVAAVPAKKPRRDMASCVFMKTAPDLQRVLR
jgi:hypothetical protein